MKTIKTILILSIFLTFFSCNKNVIEPDTFAFKSVELNGTELFVCPIDINAAVPWSFPDSVFLPNEGYYTYVFEETGALSHTDGAANTATIYEIQGDVNSAACLCNNLDTLGYDDWYLPSIDELDALYKNKDEIGGFSDVDYWSSTEEDNDDAYYQSFKDGFINNSNEKDALKRVRCIRK